EMDPAQDLLLARSERVDALRRRAALLERAAELRTHPRKVQERGDQLERKRLLAIEVARHGSQHEQAHGLAERVVGTVRQNALRPAKQLMTRTHTERCVDVEQQRLELLRVQ